MSYEIWIEILTSGNPSLDEHDLVVEVLVPGPLRVKGLFRPYSAYGKPLIRLTPPGWDRKSMLRLFVHEFIHYLDFRRSAKWSLRGYRNEKDPTGSYYNHPYEFNAFYQEAVQAFEEEFEERMGAAQSSSDLVGIYYDFHLRSFLKFLSLFGKYGGLAAFSLNARYSRKEKKAACRIVPGRPGTVGCGLLGRGPERRRRRGVGAKENFGRTFFRPPEASLPSGSSRVTKPEALVPGTVPQSISSGTQPSGP